MPCWQGLPGASAARSEPSRSLTEAICLLPELISPMVGGQLDF